MEVTENAKWAWQGRLVLQPVVEEKMKNQKQNKTKSWGKNYLSAPLFLSYCLIRVRSVNIP